MHVIPRLLRQTRTAVHPGLCSVHILAAPHHNQTPHSQIHLDTLQPAGWNETACAPQVFVYQRVQAPRISIAETAAFTALFSFIFCIQP